MSTPTLESVVRCDPEVLGGTPVFAGTRVPFKNLVDYLAAGDPPERFLEHWNRSSRSCPRPDRPGRRDDEAETVQRPRQAALIATWTDDATPSNTMGAR